MSDARRRHGTDGCGISDAVDHERRARSLARKAYWDQPLETFSRRAHAWWDSLIMDGRLSGLFYANRHHLGGDVWRSSQPNPFGIRRFAAQGGKSILSLRGDNCGGSYALEREEAKRLGLTLDFWQCAAARVMPVSGIQDLIDTLRRLERPLLIHCKSGADRMGFVSVVYKHVILGEPIEEAMRQLSLRYGHIRSSRTGVLDLFFETYLAENDGGRIDFSEWLHTRCDVDRINASFRKGPVVGWVEEKVLRRE